MIFTIDDFRVESDSAAELKNDNCISKSIVLRKRDGWEMCRRRVLEGKKKTASWLKNGWDTLGGVYH